MSRWSDSYSTHPFHQSLKDFYKKVDSIKSDKVTDEALLFEIARVKKATLYIDDYLKLIDPELNNIAILNNFNTPIMQANTEIDSFISNNAIANLNNVNSHIDTILTQIRQLNTTIPSISKSSINSMIDAYNATISEALKQIDLPANITSSNAIKELKKSLIDNDDSIKSKIESMFQEIGAKYNEINSLHNTTLTDSDARKSTKTIIEDAKKDILRDAEEAKNKLTNVSTEIDELEKFYVRVYGKPEEKAESKTSGLKYELEQRLKALDTLEDNQNKKYLALVNQIESLLNGATSVGLTKAYGDARAKFETPIKWWNGIFMASLVGMSILSFFSLRDLATLDDLLKQILHSLPVIAPLIWLALYASKRRSENQRLEQEYAHKEALAKSYSSYKQQIEELQQEDKVLIVKLLESTINTISYNASEVLDKKHGDNMPIQDIMKSLTELKDIIPKLKSIP